MVGNWKATSEFRRESCQRSNRWYISLTARGQTILIGLRLSAKVTQTWMERNDFDSPFGAKFRGMNFFLSSPSSFQSKKFDILISKRQISFAFNRARPSGIAYTRRIAKREKYESFIIIILVCPIVGWLCPFQPLVAVCTAGRCRICFDHMRFAYTTRAKCVKWK